jgi:hypothetical protein
MITPSQRSLLYRACKEAGVKFDRVVASYFRVVKLPHDAIPGDMWEAALYINSLHFEGILEDIRAGRFFEEWSAEPDEPAEPDEEKKTRAWLRGKLYAACKANRISFKKLIADRYGVKERDAWDEALYIPSDELKRLIEQVEAKPALNLDSEAQ